MSSETGSGGSVQSDLAVCCAGLSKAYRMYDRPHHRLLEVLGLRSPERSESFWAVRGVDLSVRRGECVAIIGQNGAGKSTLLEMIAGTTRPDEGTVTLRGRVAALLSLGSGFNPELTGRENIHLNAAVLGLKPAEIRERFDAIAIFAGLGDHLERAVRTYSTGMSARLAFAVAAHVDADVLIVDETLAVGDGMFVQKCMRWIRSFRQRGTLLFVSHSTSLVTDLCDRAVWLDAGRVVADGVAKDVVREYAASLHRGSLQDPTIRTGRGVGVADDPATPSPSGGHAPDDAETADLRAGEIERLGLKAVMEGMRMDPGAGWWGRNGARVESARLLDADGRASAVVDSGAKVVIEVTCVADERLELPVVGYVVRNRNGLVLFADNSWLALGPDGAEAIEAGTRFVTRFTLRFPHLPAGEYAMGAAVADGPRHAFVQHHRVDDLLLFRVPKSHLVEGVVGVPMLACTIRTVGAARAKGVTP